MLTGSADEFSRGDHEFLEHLVIISNRWPDDRLGKALSLYNALSLEQRGGQSKNSERQIFGQSLPREMPWQGGNHRIGARPTRRGPRIFLSGWVSEELAGGCGARDVEPPATVLLRLVFERGGTSESLQALWPACAVRTAKCCFAASVMRAGAFVKFPLLPTRRAISWLSCPTCAAALARSYACAHCGLPARLTALCPGLRVLILPIGT